MRFSSATRRRCHVNVAMVALQLLQLLLLDSMKSGMAASTGNQSPEQMSVQSLASVDHSTDPYIFETDTVTENIRHMPSVGNGHLATNVYGSSVCVNGLYNGETGWSHRAQVPSIHASNLSVPVDCQPNAIHTFRLNVLNGVYEEVTTVADGNITITYRVYAHQFYTRLLITEVVIERPLPSSGCGSGPANFVVDRREILDVAEESDFHWSSNETHSGSGYCSSSASCYYRTGNTTIPETVDTSKNSVHLYWNEIPSQFVLAVGQTSASWTYVLAVDMNKDFAEADFRAAMTLLDAGNAQALLENHTKAFNEIWKKGDIEVDGDLHLQKVIRGSLYYIYTSLPSHHTNSPNNQFYGLSPGGLPNGANHTDYQGHVFWDMETWMYPPILMFRPDLARDMLSYRIAGIEPAKERAQSGGYKGARFPWESAQTGVEVTPVICIPCRENQQHITGDIAFAARQYVSATIDRDWLTSPQTASNVTGYQFIEQMAEFWASRPKYNSTRQRYEINGVMPPDEHAESVNNSIYTNVMASYAIYSARFSACAINATTFNHSWIDVAKRLALPFNDNKRYHEEFDGYDYLIETGTSDPRGVKQADVVMLGYPLMWSMPNDVRRNDLVHYENVTNVNGPAMTWGIFSVGWLDLKNFSLADQFFNKSYQSYAHDPFQIWTEDRLGNGAINFITGMGGFLQAVMFGYGGLRLDIEQLHIMQTRLPPATKRMLMRGIDYLGTEFDLEIDSTTVKLNFTSVGVRPLTLRSETTGDETTIRSAGSYTFDVDEELTLSPVSVSGCPPFDQPPIDIDYPPTAVTVPTTTTSSTAAIIWNGPSRVDRFLQVVGATVVGCLVSSLRQRLPW